jgi:hypothetical protein
VTLKGGLAPPGHGLLVALCHADAVVAHAAQVELSECCVPCVCACRVSCCSSQHSQVLIQRGALTNGQPTRTSLGRGLEEALMGYAPMLEAARWGNHELIQLLHDHSLTGNSKSEAFPALLVASSVRSLVDTPCCV